MYSFTFSCNVTLLLVQDGNLGKCNDKCTNDVNCIDVTYIT